MPRTVRAHPAPREPSTWTTENILRIYTATRTCRCACFHTTYIFSVTYRWSISRTEYKPFDSPTPRCRDRKIYQRIQLPAYISKGYIKITCQLRMSQTQHVVSSDPVASKFPLVLMSTPMMSSCAQMSTNKIKTWHKEIT